MKREDLKSIIEKTLYDSCIKQIVDNCIYILNNLDEENLPAVLDYSGGVKDNITLLYEHGKNIEESIVVREREIQYCVGTKKPRDYAYKRYLFTPSKELGDEDIFFLNKNMEFLRQQEKKGITPNLTYIYGR